MSDGVVLHCCWESEVGGSLSGLSGNLILITTHGIPGASLFVAGDPHLPHHRPASALHHQPVEAAVHLNNAFHLPCVLPDSHLRSAALVGQRPLLLDAGDSGLQQGHADGAGAFPSDQCGVDPAATHWHPYRLTGPAPP